MKLTDIFRYGDLIGKIAAIFNDFRHTPVGGEVTVPRVVFDLPGGQRWEADAHAARRVS